VSLASAVRGIIPFDSKLRTFIEEIFFLSH
jgi:hypothetical protein